MKPLYLCILVLSMTAFSWGQAKEIRKPNLILIMADDASAKEYSIYGGEKLRSPELDRLAEGGLVFKTAWTSPVCGPSRAVLQTGRYPSRTGYYGNWVKPSGKKFVKENLFLPQLLKEAGYRTGVYGKFHAAHHGIEPSQYGFDEHCVWSYWEGYDGPPAPGESGMNRATRYWHPGIVANGKGVPTESNDFGPDIVVEHLIEFVERSKDEPFYAYYPALLPHMAKLRSGKKAGRWAYTDVPELDAKGERIGGRRAGTLESNLEHLDHLLGKIVDSLERLEILDETVIIFTGDNGTVGYGKSKPETEVGPRVPFVVHGPGLVKPNGESDVLIDFTDLLPTLVELGGGQIPEGYKIDGRSFAPYLRGKPFEPREWIFAQLDDVRWLREEQWLLDGAGRFYYCGDNRDETQGYQEVTGSNKEQVRASRERFDAILATIPPTDFESAEMKPQWDRYFESKKDP